MHVRILCAFDEEASVWYVEDSNLPGLHIEAPSPEDMLRELRAVVPELVRLNRRMTEAVDSNDVPIELLYQHREHLPAAR